MEPRKKKPSEDGQNEHKAETALVPRPLTQLEKHFKVMAGIKSANPNAEFSAGAMYTACRERGSTRYRAALTTFVFCTLGKLKAGIMPWGTIKLSDVNKFRHTDSSDGFTENGGVDTARIAALTQRADSDGNITQPVHAAYVKEYQSAKDAPHSFTGKGANKGEWGGYWDAQKFAQMNAEGVKVVSASQYSRFFTDPEGIDDEVKADVKREREAAKEKGRSSWCPSFGGR